MSDQIQFTAINFSPMDLSINFIIGAILSAVIAWHYHKRAQKKVLRNDRNDQDPDKGGKIEVKPGQKLEITPDFS